MKKTKDFFDCFKDLLIYLLMIITLNLYINNSLLIIIITTTVLVLVNKDLFINKNIDFKKNYKNYIKLIIKYWLIGLLVMAISNGIIDDITNTEAVNETLNREAIKESLIISMIDMVIFSPICEEIIFRGAFKKQIKNKKYFCLFTAFLFGLFHVIFNNDIIHIIPYALFGYYLAKLYYETDNIYTSICMHSFHNLVCIILFIIGS